MISSTSITSTSGVTLISLSAPATAAAVAAAVAAGRRRRRRRWPTAPSRPAPPGAAGSRSTGRRRRPRAGRVLAGVGRELVEGDVRGDRRDQADGGGEQGLGDGRARRRPARCSSGAAMAWKACMIPQTVPNRPMKGEAVATMASSAQALLNPLRSRGRWWCPASGRCAGSGRRPGRRRSALGAGVAPFAQRASCSMRGRAWRGCSPASAAISSRLLARRDLASSKRVGLPVQRGEAEGLVEDHGPRPERGAGQAEHDQLHDPVGAQEQAQTTLKVSG
jgi:hypothetical protein